jgi:hypothetical protein
MSPSAAQEIKERYGGIPGGVVLEGNASGIHWVTRPRYEPCLNAFEWSDEAVYFVPIPRSSAAVLARAIAKDDRVGVSLGKAQITYGGVPESSEVAMDLKLADLLLGYIVFARAELIDDYHFANGFRPRHDTHRGNVAAFFKLDDFKFSVADKQLHLANVRFDARVIPLQDASADDGGLLLPDLRAERPVYPEFESNAQHVGQNIDHYRGETIVNRAFAYGEVAAFLRALKAKSIDLNNLASNIERGASLSTQSPSPIFDAWFDYLRDIQEHNQYQNWKTAPYNATITRLAARFCNK